MNSVLEKKHSTSCYYRITEHSELKLAAILLSQKALNYFSCFQVTCHIQDGNHSGISMLSN